MRKVNPNGSKNAPETLPRDRQWPLRLFGGLLIVLLIAILLPRQRKIVPAQSSPVDTSAGGQVENSRSMREGGGSHYRSNISSAASAEEIVASKVSQFARSRREVTLAMARKLNVNLPQDVERFFDAVESGRWEEVQTLFESLLKQRESEHPQNAKALGERFWVVGNNETTGADEPGGLRNLWGPILETFGVAEQAHIWPAQELLDYGHSILDSLRPGMIYIGGTDPGRFIPTLLNETSEGERHVIFTQNALADNTYLQYASFLYEDQLPTLNADDEQRAFQDYVSDAQRRFAHDQQFPDEPRQVRPGEDIRMEDGRIQVSGQIAVMGINEKLFQMLMAKNPDLSFAMEQSFPLTSTYGQAAPLGPIMELRVRDEQNVLTQERASQAVDYWRTIAEQLLADPAATDSQPVRLTWSKMASEQAALFLDRNYISEAEQGFQLATQLCPSSSEAVFRYVNLLLAQNRVEDALLVAENGAKADSANGQFTSLVNQLRQSRRN